MIEMSQLCCLYINSICKTQFVLLNYKVLIDLYYIMYKVRAYIHWLQVYPAVFFCEYGPANRAHRQTLCPLQSLLWNVCFLAWIKSDSRSRFLDIGFKLTSDLAKMIVDEKSSM